MGLGLSSGVMSGKEGDRSAELTRPDVELASRGSTYGHIGGTFRAIRRDRSCDRNHRRWSGSPITSSTHALVQLVH